MSKYSFLDSGNRKVPGMEWDDSVESINVRVYTRRAKKGFEDYVISRNYINDMGDLQEEIMQAIERDIGDDPDTLNDILWNGVFEIESFNMDASYKGGEQ